ncbi:sensor histidine kinase [Emticicia sp. C21]|uniref:sensor histidine kinase n=1 Tax=Emticicia sp. C21 TaxID=2302915 RepID=UPI000E3494FC|nr:histidine kinase [Emticicia sp. C21]RFS17768.1 histidine kinase [Emticicia sp. C21]
MQNKINIKNLRLYLWIGAVYLGMATLSDLVRDHKTIGIAFRNDLWRTMYIVAICNLLYEYIIPYIRKRKGFFRKTILSFFTIFLYIFFFTVGIYAWRGIGIVLHIFTPLEEFNSLSEGTSELFGLSLFSVIFFGIISHTYNHFQLRRIAQQLRIEKQEAELNYLKSQTNPHFLFNTLNNIYSLARDKSDLAPESILRLSKILRFMLYETSGAYIAIEQELKIINDYIALEQLRYDETLNVSFNYDIEDMKQAVPPLLLMPLVENAFKHGVSETRSQPFVDIHLSVRNRELVFHVKNSSEISDEGKVKENIGLSNLRRQLELLYTDYKLSVQQGDSVFTSILKINLASHV